MGNKINKLILSGFASISLMSSITPVMAQSSESSKVAMDNLMNALQEDNIRISDGSELINPDSLKTIKKEPVSVVKDYSKDILTANEASNGEGYRILNNNVNDSILQFDSNYANSFEYNTKSKSYNGQPVFDIIDGNSTHNVYNDDNPEPSLNINGGTFTSPITVDMVGAPSYPNRDNTPQYKWWWCISYDGGKTWSSDHEISKRVGEKAYTQITIGRPGTVILRFRCMNSNGQGMYYETKPYYMNLSQDCSEVTYYSKKAWIPHTDFLDTPFANGSSGVNSQDILFSFSVLGTYRFGENGYTIGDATLDNFLGKQRITKKGVGFGDDYGNQRSFSISFGSPVKVHEFQLSIGAVDGSGNVVPHNIYAITDYTEDEMPFNKTLIAKSSNNDLETFDLNGQIVDAIVVEFERNGDNITYFFDGFQVNNYETYDHVEWVTDFIEGTETMRQPYCKATGDYYPNSNTTWQRAQETLFTPSLNDINSTVAYTLLSNQTDYNQGWDRTKPQGETNLLAYSDNAKNFLNQYGATNNIASWHYYNKYTLMPRTKDGSHLIPTNKTNNGRDVYVAIAAPQWTCKNGSCAWSNMDVGWLGTNSRWWKWDPEHITFAGGASQANNYIKTIKYDLLDENGNFVKTIATVDADAGENLEELTNSIQLTETGKWKVRTTLTNAIGQTASADSGLFYVDRVSPVIEFDKNKGEPTYNATDVQVNVSDAHSGLKEWRYSISTDGGKTYSTPSQWISEATATITIKDPGENRIKVEAYDQVGNSSTSTTDIFSVLAKESEPVIIAKDDVYLVNSAVSREDILDNAIALDAVDGNITDKIELSSIEYEDRTEYIPETLDTSKITTVIATFTVTNSQGNSASITHEYDIVEMNGIVKDEVIENDIYNRFIAQDYIDTLPQDSIWLTNDAYKQMLEEALSNDENSQYSVDLNDSLEVLAYTVKGKVVDEGAVVNGARVVLYKDNVAIDSATTDENGMYVFSNVNNGSYKVRASYQSAYGYGDITVSDSDAVVSDIELTFAGSIRGRVIVNGKRSEGAQVNIYNQDTLIDTLTTDSLGSFVIRGLQSGITYRVEVITDQGIISKDVLLDSASKNAGDFIIKDQYAISGTITVDKDKDMNGILAEVYQGDALVMNVQLIKVNDTTYTFNIPAIEKGAYTIRINGVGNKDVSISDKDIVVNFAG